MFTMALVKKELSKYAIPPTTLMFKIPLDSSAMHDIKGEGNNKSIIVGFNQYKVQTQFKDNNIVASYHAYKTFTDARLLDDAKKQIQTTYGLPCYTSK